MKRVFLVLGTATVILPWLAGARVQASVIQWNFSSSVETPIKSGSGGYIPATLYIMPPGEPTPASIEIYGNQSSGTNSASVSLATLQLYSNPSVNANGPYEVGGPSAHYQLSLVLHDLASGASGSMTFRGYLGGNFPSNMTFSGSGSNLTNTFIGSATQTLTLGRNLYTVTAGPFVNPGIQGATDSDPNGYINAYVDVQPAVNSTPEPSSLVLACLGLSSLGLAAWRRRQRRRAVVDDNASKA